MWEQDFILPDEKAVYAKSRFLLPGNSGEGSGHWERGDRRAGCSRTFVRAGFWYPGILVLELIRECLRSNKQSIHQQTSEIIKKKRKKGLPISAEQSESLPVKFRSKRRRNYSSTLHLHENLLRDSTPSNRFPTLSLYHLFIFIIIIIRNDPTRTVIPQIS